MVKPKEYPFPQCPAEYDYRLFPNDLEDDDLVFFHGTARGNLLGILEKGFKIPENLPSISFARNSNLALKYACDKRCNSSLDGVVIAVQFDCIDEPYIKKESFGLHVGNFDHHPQILGYCVVPSSYSFF